MTRDDLCRFCAGLPGASHVVQWRGADVYKVGGKVFAIVTAVDGRPAVTFKTTDLAFEILSDSPGLRPAPYMASRGLRWIQHYGAPGLGEDSLRAHIRASHEMIAAKLPARTRAALKL